MNFKLLIGIGLILVGVFWGNIKDIIPEIPDDKPIVIIERPEDSLIKRWSNVCESIEDPKDRESLCVFNKVFADRVVKYEADAQQINDVYVLAAKEVFGDSIRGKYDKLSSATQGSMVSILGEENHSVLESEKQELSKSFMAFAWCLDN